MTERKRPLVLVVDDAPENNRALAGILRDDYAIRATTTVGGKTLGGVEKRPGSNCDFRWQIARPRHEGWGGAGLPLGLKGEELPTAGRIMAVAGADNAWTSNRVCKSAISPKNVSRTIVGGKGPHFDPRHRGRFHDASVQLQENHQDLCGQRSREPGLKSLIQR